MRVDYGNGINVEMGMYAKTQFLKNKLDKNFNGLTSTRKIAVLALPKALAKAAISGVLIPLALVVDRFVSVIQTCRDPKVYLGHKIAKCVLLPVKVVLAAATLPLGLAFMPLTAVPYTVMALLMLNKDLREAGLGVRLMQYEVLVAEYGQPA